MGDIADYIVDRMMDGGYHSGYTSRRTRVRPKCKHCGSTNVYWHQYPSGKWFLFTSGEAHKCKGGT